MSQIEPSTKQGAYRPRKRRRPTVAFTRTNNVSMNSHIPRGTTTALGADAEFGRPLLKVEDEQHGGRDQEDDRRDPPAAPVGRRRRASARSARPTAVITATAINPFKMSQTVLDSSGS